MADRATRGRGLLALGCALCLTVACVQRAQTPAVPAAVGRSGPQDAPAPPRTLLDEHFQRTWPNDPRGSAWFGNGAYTLFARQPGQFVAIRAPIADVPGDVTVSGTFHKVGGPPGGGYGLIVRDQAVGAGDGVDQQGQFLVAEAGDRGELGIWQRAGDRWLELLPWTASPLVLAGGASNELKVEVAGSRLRFDVNGVQVADVRVGFPAGGVGLFVGGDMNQVQLDRLVVEAAPATTNGGRSAAGAPAAPRPAAAPTPAAAPDIAAARAQLTSLAARASQDSTVMQDSAWRQEMAATLAVVEQIASGTSAASGSSPVPPDTERLRALMGDVTDNVAKILDAFASGIDSSRNPLNNKQALNEAAANLNAATRDANEVLAEVEAARGAAQGAPPRR